MKSPPASNAPPSSLYPRNQKSQDLMDYRPVALTSVVMKSFERLVLAHLKDSTGPLLDPLQFAYRANRSVDDAVNMGLHYILQHLDKPGTYARILFVDFNSAFNNIIPDTLQNKMTQLLYPPPVSVDHQIPDRQAAASEAGRTHIQHPHHQHWSSSGRCSLPTAILSPHK